MPEIVNRSCITFVGQEAVGKWSFVFPMIPKKNPANYYEIEVNNMGIYRTGVSPPHDVYIFVADLAQARSSIVDEFNVIDSRITLGALTNYDSGANVATTTSSPTVFRVDNLQPMNRFTVSQCALSQQTGDTLVEDTDMIGSLTKLVMTWNITEMTPDDSKYMEPKPFSRF